MAANDLYRFEMTFQVSIKRASTVFWYRQKEPDSSNGRDIAISLRAALETVLWDNYLKTLLSIEVSLVETVCQQFAPIKDAPSLAVGFVSFGDELGGPMPNATAAIVTKYGATWGANWRGRNFIPGLPELRFLAGRFSAAFLTDFQNLASIQEFATVEILNPESLSFDQVIFSPTMFKLFDPLVDPTEDIYSILNTVAVQPVLGTQRRRIPPRDSGASVSP